MNKLEFIKAVKTIVRDNSIDDVINQLNNPPGRKPKKHLKEISVWYNSLEQHDKERILEICKMSVDMGLFGIFCVLDGVRSISKDGELKLIYQNSDETLLNDSDQEYLHDLFINETDK